MIQEFITKHFLDKLAAKPSLVVYDQAKRYGELVKGMADEKIKVIDVTNSAILAREEAVDYWTTTIPTFPEKRLIIYLPFERPQNEEEKIFDPFFIFGLSGTIFPSDSLDTYKALCQACYPDQSEKINQLFTVGETPDFATIDAVKGGSSYPKLQSTTGEKSEKEIILALLLPDDTNKKKLVKNKGWIKEYHAFIKATIGLVSTEKTIEKIQDELWRYLLFSEFVFDLPEALPTALTSVPKASAAFQKIVLDICDRIRNRKYIEDTYIARANHISLLLKLEKQFENAKELGDIVTFAFEDNTYFDNFINNLLIGEFTKADNYLKPNQSNQIWREDANRGAYWLVGRYAYELLKELDEIGDDWKAEFQSLDTVFDYYATRLWKLDQAHRYFEKSATDVLTSNDNLKQLNNHVRTAYFEFWTKLQKRYQQLIIENGWSFNKTLKNTQLFDKEIAPLIKNSEKVAYFMVDALRFELGKELENQLDQHFEVNLIPSAAYLPTVTRFAMAALLPAADKLLVLKQKGKTLEPYMENRLIKGPKERIEYIQLDCNYGDRAALINLDNLLRKDCPDKDLLVITTTEIDIIGENLSTNAQELIQASLRKIIKAVHTLEQAGYHKVVMVADHGFVLKEGFQIGDAVSKPMGDWLLQKSRFVAGKGNGDAHLIELKPSDMDMSAEVTHFQFLQNYAVFKSGLTYFHEGLSLQENLVPCLKVTLNKRVAKAEVTINLSYKGKATGFIRTLRPSIEVSSFREGGLFGEPISIKLEAVSTKGGHLIGTTAPSQRVNPTNGLVEFEPGQAFKATLAMNENYEGNLEVIASDPVTGFEYSRIKLKTAYL